MRKGWILYKHDPANSYECTRFVEEFQKELFKLFIHFNS